MVREVRNNYVIGVVGKCSAIWISIKDRELPEVTSTSYTENCRSFNIIVRWIGNIPRANLGLTKVQTNN